MTLKRRRKKAEVKQSAAAGLVFMKAIGLYGTVRHVTTRAAYNNLCNSFNPAAVENVMCLTSLSVGWDGALYDCDFNQMLGLTVNHGAPDNIMHFDIEKLSSREIVINNHYYGCVAGAGSSCQGATTG